jgi:hypothetical protein
VSKWCQEGPSLSRGLSPISIIRLIHGKNKEPTSGLEPLTCSLRVSHSIAEGAASTAPDRSTTLLRGCYPRLVRLGTVAGDC